MRLITPPATPADLPDLITQFNAEIIQGHREAFQALREIMAEAAALSTPSSEASPADDTPETRAAANAATRRLSLRLRAATAILRVKPINEPEHSADQKLMNATDARPGAERATAGHPSARKAPPQWRGRKEASPGDSQDSEIDAGDLNDATAAAPAPPAFPNL